MSKRKRDRHDGHDVQVVADESEADAQGSSGQDMMGKREQMVAEAAYYIAEHRDFRGGDPTADWLQAEREIDLRFGAR